MQFWNPDTGKLKNNIYCHDEVVTTIEWLDTPDIQFYTSSLDKTIKLWQNNKNVQTLTQHHGKIFWKYYLKHRLLSIFLKSIDWIRSLCVSHNNQSLLSGCVSAGICGWSVETGERLFCINNAHDHPSFPELNTINSLHVILFLFYILQTISDCLHFYL